MRTDEARDVHSEFLDEGANVRPNGAVADQAEGDKGQAATSWFVVRAR